MGRGQSAGLYTSKDSPRYAGVEESKRGSYGPGLYDAHRVSSTGTPRGQMRGSGAPVFGCPPATMRGANQYEGKELARKKLGSCGPGGYDVRVSRTGTPRGQARSIPIFGGPIHQKRPDSAPVLQPGRRAETAVRYTGKDLESREDPCKANIGMLGAGLFYDVHGISRTGTPRGHTMLWRYIGRGKRAGPSFEFDVLRF